MCKLLLNFKYSLFWRFITLLHREAPAGAWAVREPVAVCLRRRGPWGGCVGRPRVSIWRKDGSPAGSVGSPGLQEDGASVMLFFAGAKIQQRFASF